MLRRERAERQEGDIIERYTIYIYVYIYIYRDGHPSVLSKGVGMATYPTSLKRDGDGHLSILSKEEW